MRIFALFFLMSNLFGSQQVIVIGAGLSGLTAAYRLQDSHDVAVYEARNRVGGRVFSVSVNGHIGELGAQNIRDGGDAENLLSLIKELGLEVEERTSPLNFNYYEQGKFTALQDFPDKDQLRQKLEKLSSTSTNMKQVLDGLLNQEDILYKACKVLLEAYEGAPLEKLSTYYSETLYHILTGGLSSVHPTTGEQRIIHHVWTKGGNSLIAEKLAASLKREVHLRHILKSISKNDQGKYVLKFENGHEATCDILILTNPCKTFKNIAIDETVIPNKTQKEIQSVEYGTNAKILIPIICKSEIAGGYSNGRLVAFLNGDKCLSNLYYVENYGNFSADSINTVLEKDVPFLKEVYELSTIEKAVVAREENLSTYNGPVGHSWINDPYALGSYYCIGPHQKEILTSMVIIDGLFVKKLFAPIDNLYFAGEHTTVLFDVGGTMEAAVESAERIAKLIQ